MSPIGMTLIQLKHTKQIFDENKILVLKVQVCHTNVNIAKLSSSWQVQYQSNWELRLVLISV